MCALLPLSLASALCGAPQCGCSHMTVRLALYKDTAAVECRLRLALVHVMCAPHALCGAATASALCEAPWCCHRQVAAHHSAGSKRVPLALALVHCRQCVKQQSSHCRITSVCFVRPLDWLLLSLEPDWAPRDSRCCSGLFSEECVKNSCFVC